MSIPLYDHTVSMDVFMKRGDELSDNVLARPGRCRDVAGNLEVKEVTLGEGEWLRRYAVCYSPQSVAKPHLVQSIFLLAGGVSARHRARYPGLLSTRGRQ